MDPLSFLGAFPKSWSDIEKMCAESPLNLAKYLPSAPKAAEELHEEAAPIASLEEVAEEKKVEGEEIAATPSAIEAAPIAPLEEVVEEKKVEGEEIAATPSATEAAIEPEQVADSEVDGAEQKEVVSEAMPEVVVEQEEKPVEVLPPVNGTLTSETNRMAAEVVRAAVEEALLASTRQAETTSTTTTETTAPESLGVVDSPAAVPVEETETQQIALVVPPEVKKEEPVVAFSSFGVFSDIARDKVKTPVVPVIAHEETLKPVAKKEEKVHVHKPHQKTSSPKEIARQVEKDLKAAKKAAKKAFKQDAKAAKKAARHTEKEAKAAKKAAHKAFDESEKARKEENKKHHHHG